MYDWNRKLGNIEKASSALFMRRKGVDLNFLHSIRVLIEKHSHFITFIPFSFCYDSTAIFARSSFSKVIFTKKHSRAREDGSLLKCFSPFSACCLYLIHACRLNVLLIRAIHIHSNENDSPMDSKRSQNGERALEEYRLSSHTHHREEDAERSFLVQSARNWWGLKKVLSHAASQIEFNFFQSGELLIFFSAQK